MKISVFGLGYVGSVSLACLAQCGYEIIGVDVNAFKVEQVNKGLPTIIEKDIDKIIKEQHELGRISATLDSRKAILATTISIVAVGTPSTKKGHASLSSLFKLARQFGSVLREKSTPHIIVVRSTIKPGTSEKLCAVIEKVSGKIKNIGFAVIYNPEFLREGSAIQDFYNPPFTLLGSDCKAAALVVAKMYAKISSKVIHTKIETAEMIKFVSNSFHALKISFANEIGNICCALNIDSQEVMSIVSQDDKLNISPLYLKPGFAYGGSCLPKDLMQLQAIADDHNIKTPVLKSISLTNRLQIERAISTIISLEKKKLGFLGLSFKAGTDDLRNSPGIILIRKLLKKGYDVSIYDKHLNLSKLMGSNKEFLEKNFSKLSSFLKKNIETIINNSEVILIMNGEIEYQQELAQYNLEGKIILDMVAASNFHYPKATYKFIN